MNFDLNIENYTKPELIEMFGLPPSYDIHSLEFKEMKLRENILNNMQINKDTQTKTLNFIVQAKNILLNTANPTPNQSSSSFGQDINSKTIESIYHMNTDLVPTKIQNKTEHMIQDRGPKPYFSSKPGEFFQGVINPLSRGTIIKNLNIDTRFRDNYYTTSSTNFILTIPFTLNNVLAMELTAIELPQSVYTISKKYDNNYFTIIVNGIAAVVSIPDGTYSSNGVTNAINNSLELLGGVYQYIQFTTNVTNISAFDYGNINGTGQVIVTINPTYASNITSLILNFQADRRGLDDRNTPLPLKLGWLLGFRNGIYENNLNYVSEGVVDVLGPQYYFLVVDDHNNNVNNGFYSAFNSSMLNSNILARLSFNTANTLNGATSYNIMPSQILNILTSTRQYFGPVNLQNLTIQLLDRYGRIVDLNNMDFSFCLTMTSAYDV
jgi:hypothetical protein